MYRRFYGFTKPPFGLTPDPSFLCLTPGHREALAQLTYGVQEKKGFILLTGEVGTGKTTLLRALLNRLPKGTAVAYAVNSTLPFDELLEYLLEDLGVPNAGVSRAQRLMALYRFLTEQYRAGINNVLIIDEAQNLDLDTLEQIRLLSNFETTSEKLVQIVLAGQPELRRRLALPELRQLKQRIALRCKIEPMSPEETRGYIADRLRIAGGSNPRTLHVRGRGDHHGLFGRSASCGQHRLRSLPPGRIRQRDSSDRCLRRAGGDRVSSKNKRMSRATRAGWSRGGDGFAWRRS